MGLFDRFRQRQPTPTPRLAPSTKAETQPIQQYRNAVMASASNRLTNNWYKSLRAPNREIESDLKTARSLSRHLAYNSSFVAKYLQLLRTNVVGPKGTQLIASVVGPDGNYNDDINRLLVKSWEEWKEVADLRGIDSYTDIEGKALRTAAMDGECFIRLITDRRVNRFGLALQFIDADLLDHRFTVANPAGNSIIQGIEVDELTGRPVAYHFFNRHPDERLGLPLQRIRVEADEVIHLARPIRAGQYRGLPWIVPSMEFLARLDEYMDAELVAAQAGACQLGFITTENPPTDPSGILPSTDPTTVKRPMEVIDLQPGQLGRLAPGEDVKPFSGGHPNNAFPQFVQTILYGSAAGLGVSYTSLTGDLSEANYASGRLGSIDERDMYRELQEWMIRVLHKRVYQVWLKSALAMNALPLPSKNPADYSAFTFRGRGWRWVDPLKDMKAYESAIALNLISKTDVCAEQGMDWREVLEQRYEEQRLEQLYALHLKQEAPPESSAPQSEESVDTPNTTDNTPTTEEDVEQESVEEQSNDAV